MKVFLFLLLFFTPWFDHAPADSVDTAARKEIHWNKVRKLEWKDFKARANRKSDFSAVTHSVINYGYEVREDHEPPYVHMNIEVNCFFDPKQSWVKKSHKTDELLAHEQLHFDISELYARRLRMELNGYLETLKKGSNYKKDTERIFNSVLKEWGRVQDQYDRETDHGQVSSAQKKWHKEITKELETTRPFAKGAILISNF